MLAVTAIGADQPGIIARVTGVLLEQGGNLEDASMTILGGQFAIMLLVSTEVAPAQLEQSLASATADLGLVVTVRAVGPGASSTPATHMLTVYGSDRPGIVAAVTAQLAESGVNVTDLTTRVLDGERPVYAMMLEINVPEALGDADIRAAISVKVPDLEVSVAPLDIAGL